MAKNKEAKVVGFNLLKISVERKPKVEKFGIDANLKMTDIRRTKISVGRGKEVLAFSFEYSIIYRENVAKLIFVGNVLVLTDNKLAKQIAKDWDNNKNVEKGIRTGVYNVIFQKCNIKALQLEEDIGLPLHMAMPILQPAGEIKDKASEKERAGEKEKTSEK